MLDAGDRVMGNGSGTGKQRALGREVTLPVASAVGAAGWSPVGRPACVALLGHLDCGVQGSYAFKEPPMVPDPSPDQEVSMGGQNRADAT